MDQLEDLQEMILGYSSKSHQDPEVPRFHDYSEKEMIHNILTSRLKFAFYKREIKILLGEATPKGKRYVKENRGTPKYNNIIIESS